MTDSQNNDVEGLPTAAIEEKCVECGMVDLVYSTDYEGRGSNCSNPESKDQELIRRSDVKNLIQDKIEKLHNLNTQFQEEHRDIPYPVKENIDQIKKDLLDELEGEA